MAFAFSTFFINFVVELYYKSINKNVIFKHYVKDNRNSD